MTKRWMRYAVFISSTFLDMDAERDAIKFTVVPALNKHFRSQRIEFQAIDLRSGINTERLSENQREERVLDVCFSAIDMARPLFIGLLGNRYGWIPPKERIEHILGCMDQEKRLLLGNTDGLSVTELEILYGAIGENGKYLDHSFFYYRLPSSYLLIPQERKPDFCDDSNPNLTESEKVQLRRKRDDLRRRIRDLVVESASSETMFTEYGLSYDSERMEFSGLNDFCEKVFRQISSIIQKEIKQLEPSAMSWFHQEADTSHLLQSHFIVDSIDRIGNWEDYPSQCYFGGEAGSGKTVLLSQLYDHCPLNESRKHIAYVGLSPFANRMRTILLRWLAEMKIRRDENIPDEQTLPDAELYRLFRSSASGHVFFLDAVDRLPANEQNLAWLREDINIFLTGNKDCFQICSRLNHKLELVFIQPYSRLEKEQVLSLYSKKSFYDIPVFISSDILQHSFTPSQLSLILSTLSGLTQQDYQTIRARGGQIEDINHYLGQIYSDTASKSATMFSHVLERHILYFTPQPEHMMRIFRFLALSPLGLRESDMEALAGDNWDALCFNRIVNTLPGFFIRDSQTLCWKISDSTMSQELRSGNLTSLYVDLADCVLSLPDGDGLKRDIGIYLAIKAHGSPITVPYLGSREHFVDYEDVSSWYFFATNLLETDPVAESDLDCTCMAMDCAHRAVFLRHYFAYGCGFYRQTELQVRMVRKHLMGAEVHTMDAISAFAYGWLMVETELYLRYPGNIPANEREIFLLAALKGFERAISLDPSNHAANSMLTSAGTALLDTYIEQKRFNDFKQLYTHIKTVNT